MAQKQEKILANHFGPSDVIVVLCGHAKLYLFFQQMVNNYPLLSTKTVQQWCCKINIAMRNVYLKCQDPSGNHWAAVWAPLGLEEAALLPDKEIAFSQNWSSTRISQSSYNLKFC